MLRWRLVDLAQWIREEFALSAKRHTLGRELRAMGYRKLSARPGHRGQRPGDIAYLKKLCLPSAADQAEAPKRNAGRAVAAGRSPRRSADQAHQTLGQTRHSTFGTQGSAAILGMGIVFETKARYREKSQRLPTVGTRKIVRNVSLRGAVRHSLRFPALRGARRLGILEILLAAHPEGERAEGIGYRPFAHMLFRPAGLRGVFVTRRL